MSEFGGDPLAIATVLIRPDTSKFRATLEAELAAATRAPITVPVAPVAVTTGGRAAAAELQAAGAAASTTSIAIRKEAAAAREAAVAHEQLSRGAAASVLSLTGVRGATLAASGPFLAGAATITLFAKSVKEATAEIEAAARVGRILGDELGKGSEKWAKTLANSFGLSATAALKFEGAIAEVFHNVGVNTDQTAQLSQSLVQLSADVAAFNDAANDQVLRAFQLALSGNLRGLRQFVPGVTAASVAQQALADTGKKTVTSLTQQELVLARYEQILTAASNQVGAFRDRQGSLANQSKILQSNLQNLSADIGSALIPVLVQTAKLANRVASDFAFLVDATKQLAAPVAKNSEVQKASNILLKGYGIQLLATISPLAAYTEGVNALGRAFGFWGGAARDANDAATITLADFNRMRGQIPLIVNAFGDLTNGFEQAARAFRQGLNLQVRVDTNQLDTLNNQLLVAQNNGATLAQQLTGAGGIVAKARKAAEDAQKALSAQPGSPAAKQRKQQADQALAAALTQQSGIQGQIQSAADAAAAAAKKRADAAKAALAQQDQDLLTAQQFAQNQVEIAKAHAAATKPLEDDIAAARRELALTNQQIVEAQKIHDANLRKQTIQALTLQSVQAQAAIADLRRQQAAEAKAAREAAAQRRADRRQAALASVDADIEFAQITKNKSAEIRAHEAKIRLLEAQIKNATVASVKWKQLRNERAREEQAIKDLKKQTDTRNNAAEQLAFSILQEQQGFVGKLLSNLLPTSAVAGTVGGAGAVSTPTGPGAADFATAVHQHPPASTGPGQAVHAAAAVSQGAGGATTGQMATLIILMRQLVGIVGGKKVAPRHPEATYQTYTSSTEMAHPL